MGSSTISTLVAALARFSSMVVKLESGASLIMLAEGMMTGGGVAMWTGDEGMMVVTRGDDIVSLWSTAARTALRYALRSPTDSYSSRKELIVMIVVVGKEGGGKLSCYRRSPLSFMLSWALLLPRGIGD